MSESKFPDRDPTPYLERARESLQSQLDSCESIGGRLDSVFGWSVGVLSILFAVLALRPHAFDALGYILLALCSLAFLLVAGITIQEARGSAYSTGAELERVWQDLWTDASDREITWRIANNYRSSEESNEPRQAKQLGHLRVSVVALLIQTLALIASLALVAS